MLSIRNLSKTYANGIQALRDISLNVECGLFGLLGPNGAGKSSLMRTLATLQGPDGGSIALDGQDIFRNPQETRRHLGYLPQDFGVYPQITAQEMLEQLAVFKGFTERRSRQALVQEQLRLVNLYDKRHQKLGTFSGGMRQRFGIAQALLGAPKLVIVDEPTAGLDPAERIRFHNLLAEMGRDRVLILSTHIVEDVIDLCPRIAILNQGQIVAQGCPQDLIGALRDRVWVKPLDDKEIVDSAANQAQWQAQWNVITLRMIQGQRFVRVLSDEQPGAGFEITEPDLNDVYFTTLAA
ncbi:MAG: ABC transporter ATP-binding protein [Synechococcales cyanobacterium RM1_1_8]|nr:ABC transporter ATP-binding protein [Synechococcales cyanobacterium RM1_1_8]